MNGCYLRRMLRLLVIITILIQSFSSFSQDYIIVKDKAGRTIKRIYLGFPVTYETKDRNFIEGPVAAIRNDSILVRMFEVREYPTEIGFILRDTISTYLIGNNYHDIRRIELHEKRRSRRSFGREKAEQLLMIGGAGYFLLNILNGAFFKEPVTNPKNLRSLQISIGLFGVGLFLNKVVGVKSQYTTKKHKIIYIDL